MKKKILSALLALVMVLSAAPLSAFAAESVTYIDRCWDATAGKVVEETKTATATPIESATTATILNGGWYVVDGTVKCSASITVLGTSDNPTCIILADGCEFTATKGIRAGDGYVLVIYGQADDTGSLTSKGSSKAAGIGGDSKGTGGTVIIKGGTVTATGYAKAAGIGGGADGAGGTVTVYGGNVTAVGGDTAAGIGSGQDLAGGNTANGGTVTVYGGMVTATGGKSAAGIGTGSGLLADDPRTISAGTVTVNGGTVTATGGSASAGIGGGERVAGGTVTVNGGTVTATGGLDAAGIGGGYYGAGGTVTVNGGTVTATGGQDYAGVASGLVVAGIGCGNSGKGDGTLSGDFDVMKAGDAAPGTPTTLENYLTARSKYAYIHTHDYIASYTDNGDGTHTGTCSCGVTGTPEAHTFVNGVCVCGAKEPVTLNWNDLQGAYNTAEESNKNDYTTSSWTDSGIEKALSDAKSALDAKTLTNQNDIDALTTALTTAIGKLEKLTVTDYHILNKTCDSFESKGGLMGRQFKNGDANVGRTIIGLTAEQLADVGDKLVIVGGDLGKQTAFSIDCAYTYFYNGETKITAESMSCAAFIIIDADAEGSSISGYGYYRIYNGSAETEANFMFDTLNAAPVK